MENHKQTTNYLLYEIDRDYKCYTNFDKYIKEADNFYNGDQYPNNNKNNDIRVTLNICKQSVQIKSSKICGTPIYLTFTASDSETDCTALQRFDEYNRNKLKDDMANYQSSLNGFSRGTEIYFYRWDEDDTSYKGIYKGGLAGEHIDILKFAVENNTIQDIQNQEWVMFWGDYPINGIKKYIEGDKEAKMKLIERQDDTPEKAHVNNGLVTMFTRYFRINGEVYFMCSTEYVDLFEYPHPLNKKALTEKVKKIIDDYKKEQNDPSKRDPNALVSDYKIDYEDLIMQLKADSKFSDQDYGKVKEKFSLYPFAVFRPIFVNGSFYGASDIKSLIKIQKGINFQLSMNLQCAQNNAYGKIFVKPDALRDQVITNEPGQVLVDNTPYVNGWGIKMAENQPVPNGLIESAQALYNMARVVNGFSDVMDGTVSNQDISGYMLQQMIKQNNTSIEQQQQLLWEFNEQKAEIRLMFYKHYVDKAKYTYERDPNDFDEQEDARLEIKDALSRGRKSIAFPDAKEEDFAKPTHKVLIGELNNDDIYGKDFDIAVDAMQGLADSKLIEQQAWENMIMNGQLQNVEPEYLELMLLKSPSFSERTKIALKGAIEKLKKGKIARLQQQLMQSEQLGLQAVQYGKGLEAKLGMQSEYLKNMESEFGTKINNANKIINGLTKQMDAMNKNKTQAIQQAQNPIQ